MPLLTLGLIAMALTRQTPNFWSFAATPPMGWNSWDCFATTVTEEQTRAQADVMAKELKAFGWKYVVVDIQWYEPKAVSFDYRANAELIHDSFGRLLPATNRFPSAAGGHGFGPLAKYVHSLGLKFGIHLMRGIPRQCVDANTPIKGTSFHAQDIADKNSVCPWNPDMYGVDMTKPGAQEYYDSVFDQIAHWGVDFVKVDDIARPYHDHVLEIEAIRKSIDKTGRRMVLSLSPGETPVDAADHVSRHANMWRISDDFWDSWPALVEQFERCHKWSAVNGPGHYPDADMLPLGYVRFGEKTHFTNEEQRTMLSLWAIFRSPLMLGCDLTRLDDWTRSLITNPEVLRVNQHGIGPAQLYRRGTKVVWHSESDRDHEVFVALFNLADGPDVIQASLKDLGFESACQVKDLWSGQSLSTAESEVSLEVPAHGSRLLSVSLPAKLKGH